MTRALPIAGLLARQLMELGWRYETKTHAGGHAVADADVSALVAFAKAAIRDCR